MEHSSLSIEASPLRLPLVVRSARPVSDNALWEFCRAKLCPDFVAELRSPSDDLATLQAKLGEYLACGCQLGWLLDPSTRSVHVYRPGADPEILADPVSLSGDPVLPGFVLVLDELW